MPLSEKDQEDLKRAKALLENPGLAAKLTNTLGAPLEKGFALLPDRWNKAVSRAVNISLERGLEVALVSLGETEPGKSPSNRLHTVAACLSGGIGGAFGLGALSVELPVSTTIMLRSIADIARSHGEPLSDIEARLACLEVFALGGRSPKDDASEAGYYTLRSALAKAVSSAAEHLSRKGFSDKSAPALVKLISQISTRFGVTVSEKVAATAVPLVGAFGGSVINTIFMNHFQCMAEGHFTVRRLERAHGKEVVEHAYREL